MEYAVSNTGKKKLPNYNISVGSRRTTVRLSPQTYEAIEQIAEIEKCDPKNIFEFVARTKDNGVPVSTAIREFVIRYFLEAATAEGHRLAGHGSLIKRFYLPPSELANIGQLLCGKQWKAQLARHLGVSCITVIRWADGTHPVPEAISEKLRQLAWEKHKELEKLFPSPATSDYLGKLEGIAASTDIPDTAS